MSPFHGTQTLLPIEILRYSLQPPKRSIGVVGKGQNNAYIAQSFTFSADSDGDGIPDLFDTYIYVPSSSDWDNDGLLVQLDNCPYVWNLDRAFNSDNDLYGDACDTDIDGDDITNTIPIDLIPHQISINVHMSLPTVLRIRMAMVVKMMRTLTV